jgi:hypothetical protein
MVPVCQAATNGVREHGLNVRRGSTHTVSCGDGGGIAPQISPTVTGVSPTSKHCLGDCVARHVEVSDVTHGTGTVSEPATHDS